MSHPAPPHPASIIRIPQTRRAKIMTHDGWWFQYAVHRTIGIGIPENSVSVHRSLEGARRAAERWCRKPSGGAVVETVEAPAP